jgi:hypothetical protein
MVAFSKVLFRVRTRKPSIAASETITRKESSPVQGRSFFAVIRVLSINLSLVHCCGEASPFI